MKYALIGCGRISTNHIKAALVNNFDIVAVCDINREHIDALISKHPQIGEGRTVAYADYREMLDKHKDIELVSIATESGKHAEIALYCIRHRINVIIEKPMAMSIADANLIISEGQRYGVKVCACHQNRFNIAVQKTRKAFEEGRFGKLSHGSIHVRWNRNKEYFDQAKWRGTWAQDGGALMNQCIHGIDLLRWMMGDEIDEVYGVTRQRFHDYIECEDIGMAVIKFKNGSIGTIEGTTNVYPKNLEETLCIFGERGTVKLGGKSVNTIDVWDFAEDINSDSYTNGFSEQTENVYGNGHIRLFADMVAAIRENRAPYVDAYAGKRALELVLAVYSSASEGKPIKLPLKNCSTLDFA